MALIGSLLLGRDGTYNILSVQVEFKKKSNPFFFCSFNENPISKLMSAVMNNRPIQIISLGYIHLFVHEMCHALSAKVLANIEESQITIYRDKFSGVARYHGSINVTANWKQNFISAAGPVGDITFSICQLIALKALKNYIAYPIALIVAGGAITWIAGEFLYCVLSAASRDEGDFGEIAKRSYTHLAIASAIVIGQVALVSLNTYNLFF